MAAFKCPNNTALADSWITHNSLQYRCDIVELIMNVKQLLYDNITWVMWARYNIQSQHDTEICSRIDCRGDQNTFYYRRLQARQWLIFASQSSHTLTRLTWWHWTCHWTYDWSPWGFSPQVQRVEIWIPSTDMFRLVSFIWATWTHVSSSTSGVPPSWSVSRPECDLTGSRVMVDLLKPACQVAPGDRHFLSATTSF